MPRAQSEYEVEDIFIDKLTTMGYDYVQLNNYDDVIKNFRIQLCKLNEKVLKEHQSGCSGFQLSEKPSSEKPIPY